MQSQNTNNQKLTSENVAEILSQTLKDVFERKITLKHAQVISKLALALSKTLATVEVKQKLEFIELMLKNKIK